MLKNCLFILSGIILGVILINICFAEQLTITTYYPSPYGIYKNLQAAALGIGDANDDGDINNSDIPTTQGQIHAEGLIRTNTGFQAKGSNGTSGDVTIVSGCTIKVKGGLIVPGGTCTIN